jgi:plasmid stabilization system protein ParE
VVPPRYSTEALADLSAYWAYVATDRGEATATRVVREIHDAIERLGVMPALGRERPEIADGVRSWSLPHRQTAYYRIATDSKNPVVLIARILHGAMDPERLADAVELSRSSSENI